MYSPTTRLLTVLELLQSHKQMSGAEIARRLEVDPRTVRRYIVILQDMGIPVEGERGPYGAYQLRRGYKLPPLMFTDGEAIALTLGLLAMRELKFPVNLAAVEGALAKAERAMPEKLLLQARALRDAITFNVLPPPAPLENDFVAPLSLAVQQHQPVLLRYRSWRGEQTQRRFDPYGIVFNEGYWYTAGYCHLRRDLRTFRLDRMIALEPLEGSFDRPADFDVLGHVLASLATMPGTYPVEVLLQTSIENARQVIPQGMGLLEEAPAGVILRRSATQLEWVANFLLSLDFPVRVLQPPEMQEILRYIAAKALRIAGAGEEIRL
jgi:predicted DNA-binding transcriptional regulator YafY